MTNFHNLPPTIALDLGTTKFCIATLGFVKGELIPRIETISVDAEGMRRGMLASLDKAKGALERLLEIAERELKIDIRKVVVGVAGSHLQSRFLITHHKLDQTKVDAALLARLVQQVREQQASLGRDFLHVIPVAYQLDERGWIDQPIGFSGKQLSAKYFVVEADKHYLADIIKLCNQCGLEVQRLYAEPLASSSVVSSADAKLYGLVTADIGGGTTDGIVYLAGKPVKTFTVNIAGKLMSNDLAIGLGVSYEEAERIKLKYGLLRAGLPAQFEGRGLHGESKMISLDRVHAILGSRIEELTCLIYEEVKMFKGQLHSGILLTGGGAEVKGMEEFLGTLLHTRVYKESPQISPVHFPSSDSAAANPTSSQEVRYLASKYATAVGLLHLELNHYLQSIDLKKSYFFEKYFHQFFHWLRELA